MSSEFIPICFRLWTICFLESAMTMHASPISFFKELTAQDSHWFTCWPLKFPLSVCFPPHFFESCANVRKGVKKSISWLSLSKRNSSTIVTSPFRQLDALFQEIMDQRLNNNSEDKKCRNCTIRNNHKLLSSIMNYRQNYTTPPVWMEFG